MAESKKPKKPKKPRKPKKNDPAEDETFVEDDEFLADLDADLDEIVSAPTEEHPAPEGAIEPGGDEDADDDDDDEDTAVYDGALEDEEGVFEGNGEPLEPVAEGDEDDGDDEDEDEELDDPPVDEQDEDEDFEDEEYEDEEAGTAEQPTEVAVAASGGGAGSGGGDGQTDFGRPRRRFPTWASFLTGSLAVVASVAAATAASLILYLGDIAEGLADEEDLPGVDKLLETVDGGAPQTILVVGSDKRLGDGAGNGLSDTSILLRLDPDKDAIALFSIPRDLVVNIPGHGTDTFNTAFSLGGPQLTLDTVKSLTGLEVNHLVNVNFRGFAKAVQAIGCVYVDVDRRYFHSNEGLSASAQYAEIDVRPGYQRLCGFKALQYVRFRHTDNDIVRSARQQDFLRQARARVPATKLFSDRKELIKIFTDYTSSDINDAGTMLQVLKLFIEARDQPVKEVHFEGTVGNRVTATPGQIEQAVSQFLGIEGSTGPRGDTAAGEDPGATPTPEEPPPAEGSQAAKGGKGTPVEPAAPAKPKKKSPTAGLETGNFGKKLAFRIRRRNRNFPVYYPGAIIPGSEYDQRPRAYTLKDKSLDPSDTFGYKFTLSTPDGQYYGMQGLSWKDPPILDEPHETKEFGDRTYNLYFSNDRLRLVSWETDDGVYWVSNTLLQSLSGEEMLGIARGAKVLEPPEPPSGK